MTTMFLMLTQLRQFLLEKSPRADVLQADRVQHSGRGLPQARRRIADHGLFRQSLDDESAQFAQVHDIFKLDAVAERAAGSDHWILERNAGDAYAEVGSHG